MQQQRGEQRADCLGDLVGQPLQAAREFLPVGGVKPVTSGWRGPAVPPYRSAAQRVSDERHDHTHAQSVKGVGDDQPLQDPILPVQLAASIDPVAGRVAAGSGSLAMSVTAPTRPGR
ncbi:MAG: hypothetical protein M0Z84_03770 [Gammaproteobacteria bacterium]|nr:hypothetical protein [Gammaproteobacteria bacterium]